MSLLLALLFAPTAEAGGAHVIAAAGGRDFPSDQFWAGLEYDFFPDRFTGFAPIARVAPGYTFADRFGMVQTEIGLTFAPERADAPEIIRGGLIASGTFLGTDLRLPWAFGESDNGRNYGVVPAIEAMIEFEYGKDKERNFVFGVRGGVGSGSTNIYCDDPSDTDCIAWTPVFAGGFYARGMLTKSGLYINALLGVSPRLTLGYKF